jgi:sulfopyruvate decarboxylase subunit alpha
VCSGASTEKHLGTIDEVWGYRHMTITQWSVPASAIISALTELHVTDMVTMPDYVQISVNHKIAQGDLPGVRVINCATEDEAVAIGFGLHIGGRLPFLSMQNQGLFACANALRSVGVNSRTPLLILAGQWGRELSNLGRDPAESTRTEVRLTEPLLDALELPNYRLEGPNDLGVIRHAFDASRTRSLPAVVLIGAHTSWD